ncbi:MAG: dTDP-4-dehydrorhamnose 3,5-epimerase [Victivallales bacterium]|nr:dTDP-4-dehydrorhamnose 3,5-epimerase [Victivallales bacterium]
MKVIKTEIPDILIIEPTVFRDSRGYFFEVWKKSAYEEIGIQCDFVQDNESKSGYGVLRGLHYQAAPFSQAKLVRAITGTILDVVVDIRKNSATYGHHVAIELTGENKRQIFIPRGFAHGFVVLSDEATISYKCDQQYSPASERGIQFNDPALGIDWRLPPEALILSEKDKRHPSFADTTPWEEQP